MVQFIILSLIIWILNLLVQQVFPTENNFPFFIRTTLAATMIVSLFLGTKRLLLKNNISNDALGLSLSFKTLLNILFGSLLAVSVLVLTGSFIYVFVPFHFEMGSLSGINAEKHAISFFCTNTLEELIFRGFPLLVLSKVYGWRKAVYFLALPFGLFHLYGLGLGIAVFKMVLTTAAYSFIFCYAYIVTDSLITAISVHWFSNVLLHIVIGMDGEGNAILQPKFHGSWPTFDISFFAFLLSVVIVACLLFFAIGKRYNSK
ncbi:MAG TPA: CPBP family intramembrane glutamic endopeptidase [Cyclobacteriaceae bacterium]|nr:CPBP family intramembrane glutamic endopeptidase [Cyclobacteriaceae bacterium]